MAHKNIPNGLGRKGFYKWPLVEDHDPIHSTKMCPNMFQKWKLCLFFSLYITFPLFFHEYYYQRIVHTWEPESEKEQKTTKIHLSSSDAKVKWGEKPGINFLIYSILQEKVPVLQLNYMSRYIKYTKLSGVGEYGKIKRCTAFCWSSNVHFFPLTQKGLRYYCIYIYTKLLR